tara:strand:- start:202 stop:879 length:678 start_codon:yes stop_codon:yes gene_type:complete
MILTKERTALFKAKLKTMVDGALDTRGMSARQASIATVGNDGLIRDIRAGRVPSADRLEALAELLNMEFYFGPHREVIADRQQVGPDFAKIPRYDVELSAGSGKLNDSNLPMSSLAFRVDWLAKMGINPSRCVIVSVAGDSMEPTLYDGDLVMLDRQATTVRDMRLFGVVDTDGTAKVKRLQKLDQQLILHSDNRYYPADVRSAQDADRMTIIGQVVWSGHDFER